MKSFRIGRFFTSLVGLTVVIAAAGPAGAITPHRCDARHGGNGGGSYFTGWSQLYLSELVVFHGPAGGKGNVVNGLFPTWCGKTSQGFTVCEQKGIGRAVGTRFSFPLDWQRGERLLVVQGRTGTYVDSIEFETNFKRSGLLGGPGGTKPYVDGTGNGLFWNDFWGTAGSVIDSIGFCNVAP